jgi:hypothetical protein
MVKKQQTQVWLANYYHLFMIVCWYHQVLYVNFIFEKYKSLIRIREILELLEVETSELEVTLNNTSEHSLEMLCSYQTLVNNILPRTREIVSTDFDQLSLYELDETLEMLEDYIDINENPDELFERECQKWENEIGM